MDTRTGPAVFWGLSALKRGAAVEVSRVDGRTAVFTVDRTASYSKAAFPRQRSTVRRRTRSCA
ncbi:hypothetical protein ACFQZC_24540 [Streptacidiphilus monticola]